MMRTPVEESAVLRALGELAREPDSERLAHEDEFATGRELSEKADFALFEVARLESAEDR